MQKLKSSVIAVSAVLALTGCIEKEKIAHIGDAENILFTSQGDLLVSGGKSLFQVTAYTADNGDLTYSADEVYEGRNCAFGGIAQSGDWVFSVCKEIYLEWKNWTFATVQDTHLVAANINQRPLRFKRLDEGLENDPMDSMLVPNGMGFAPTGELILADTNFFGPSSVARITLDYSGELPKVATFDADWLGQEYGFESPNGVRIEGNQLYVSDANHVRRFTFDENGNVPLLFTDANGNEISNLPDDNLFYTGGIVVDDIQPYCGGIAVTHFIESKLVFQDANGKKYKTLPLSFDAPTALAIGAGQGFTGRDLMVTEKGVLFETGSNIGNGINRVPMDLDLSDPATCEVLQEG